MSTFIFNSKKSMKRPGESRDLLIYVAQRNCLILCNILLSSKKSYAIVDLFDQRTEFRLVYKDMRYL